MYTLKKLKTQNNCLLCWEDYNSSLYYCNLCQFSICQKCYQVYLQHKYTKCPQCRVNIVDTNKPNLSRISLQSENIVNVIKFFFVIGFVFTCKLNLIYILINLIIGFLILTAIFLLGYFFYNPLFFSQLLFNLYQIVYRPII